jgi:predicted nucleic acid-binding protein
VSNFIPDASVCMAWCFEDEINAYSEALLARLEADEEALVPHVWPLEIANALVKAKQRGRVTETQIAGFLEDLAEFAIIVDTLDKNRALTEVRHVADKYKLTAYDAAYLELAMRSSVALATFDDQLLEAAKAAGAAIVEDISHV